MGNDSEEDKRCVVTANGLEKSSGIIIGITAGSKAWKTTLVDSGAADLVVSTNLVQNIERELSEEEQRKGNRKIGRFFQKIKTQKTKIRGAFGKKTATAYGKLQIAFVIETDGGTRKLFIYEFFQIDQLTDQLILESDFMRRYQCTLRYQKDKVQLYLPEITKKAREILENNEEQEK